MNYQKVHLAERRVESLKLSTRFKTLHVSLTRLRTVDLMRRCVKAQKEKLGSGHPGYRNNDSILVQWESKLGHLESRSVVS